MAEEKILNKEQRTNKRARIKNTGTNKILLSRMSWTSISSKLSGVFQENPQKSNIEPAMTWIRTDVGGETRTLDLSCKMFALNPFLSKWSARVWLVFPFRASDLQLHHRSGSCRVAAPRSNMQMRTIIESRWRTFLICVHEFGESTKTHMRWLSQWFGIHTAMSRNNYFGAVGDKDSNHNHKKIWTKM